MLVSWAAWGCVTPFRFAVVSPSKQHQSWAAAANQRPPVSACLAPGAGKLRPHARHRDRAFAGGLAPDHSRWIRRLASFFLTVRVLSKVFRGKFVDGLKRLFRAHKLAFHGSLRSLADSKRFRQFLRHLFRKDWVVYVKQPFGGPAYVLQYLARYTHRVAISNHRPIAFEDGKVSFRLKDYAHGSKKRKMTVSTDELLRRFLLHVLSRGFVASDTLDCLRTAAAPDW